MALEEKVFPYEFLVRWYRTAGKLQGYHVKLATVVFKDGKEIARTEGDALNAETAIKAGFALDDILDVVHTDALTVMDEAKAQAKSDVAAAKAEKDEAIATAKKNAEEAIASANAEKEKAVSELKAQLAEMESALAAAKEPPA